MGGQLVTTLLSVAAQLLFPYGETAGDDVTLPDLINSVIGPIQLEAPFLYYMKDEYIYYVRIGTHLKTTVKPPIKDPPRKGQPLGPKTFP